MALMRFCRLINVGRPGWASVAAMCLMFVHAMGGPAFAQRPVTQMPNEDSAYIAWGVALGIALLVCLPAFLNSKRSHLS
jgi:hypothetical protein